MTKNVSIETSQQASAAAITQEEIQQFISEIIDNGFQRRNLHKAEKSEVLRMKAICRRRVSKKILQKYDLYDDFGAKFDEDERIKRKDKSLAEIRKEAEILYKSATGNNNTDDEFIKETSRQLIPYLSAYNLLNNARLDVEKRMVKTVIKLPVYHWIKSICGLGPLGIACIIAETGDLANYSSVNKLYMRLGLGVINGEGQRRCTGEKALLHRFNPERRATSWTVADSLLRQKGKNIYYDIYANRKEYEKERNPEIANIYAHKRAKRYAEKKMIKDLYRNWVAYYPKS